MGGDLTSVADSTVATSSSGSSCEALGSIEEDSGFSMDVSERQRERNKGGGLFEFQTLPPPDPPKVLEPVFLQFEIWGKGLAPKAPKKIFPFLRGNFFLPYVSILKILRILWRIQKCLENTENFLTPDLTCGSDLGWWEPQLMGKFFLKIFLPYLCMFKMIIASWGSF